MKPLIETGTIRRRFFHIAGPVTRSGRKDTLHLPTHRPRAEQFLTALDRLCKVELVT